MQLLSFCAKFKSRCHSGSFPCLSVQWILPVKLARCLSLSGERIGSNESRQNEAKSILHLSDSLPTCQLDSGASAWGDHGCLLLSEFFALASYKCWHASGSLFLFWMITGNEKKEVHTVQIKKKKCSSWLEKKNRTGWWVPARVAEAIYQ